MSITLQTGEFVRLNKDYSWADGKYAGQVVQISEVHDHREQYDDADALIYGAARHYPDSDMSVTGIPVLPEDIDESYDHYEAQRAADFNRFLAGVVA